MPAAWPAASPSSRAAAGVAYPILFLACAESSFVTGISLIVDAGKSIT
jgi:hypothetical protein